MGVSRSFTARALAELSDSRIMGVRAGTTHKFTAVWGVVVGKRVLARSWSDKPSGWFRAFLDQPNGSISIGTRELRVRAKPVRGARLLDAMDRAYARKYATPASRKWVRGFARPSRRRHTLEFVPR